MTLRGVFWCIVALQLTASFQGRGRLLARADFVYVDFNDTLGLSFVGSATTSACVNMSSLSYGDVQGDGDTFLGSLPEEVGETPDSWVTTTTVTNSQDELQAISDGQAAFGHRREIRESPDAASKRCRNRARLTPSLPGKAGAMWYDQPVTVTRGFETMFTFQVTDHSRHCTEHRDPYFSTARHRSCSVRGGDGLAFVLHGDPQEAVALGESGQQMGYGGIQNSLAVELDMWYNAGTNSSDLLYDHVAIHSGGNSVRASSSGSASGGNNSALAFTELGTPRAVDLGDGKHHLIKVCYFDHLATQYISSFTFSPALEPYVVDAGEQRRLGTLVVWVDNGVYTDTPLLAIPLNLPHLLGLAQDTAYVGFTSSTGKAWAKHDVLSWVFCHEEDEGGQEGGGDGGGEGGGGMSCLHKPEADSFSYHQTSQFYSTPRFRENNPGPGYGGGGGRPGTSQHSSPDVGAWEAPKQHFASRRKEGIFDSSGQGQVPPFVEN